MFNYNNDGRAPIPKRHMETRALWEPLIFRLARVTFRAQERTTSQSSPAFRADRLRSNLSDKTETIQKRTWTENVFITYNENADTHPEREWQQIKHTSESFARRRKIRVNVRNNEFAGRRWTVSDDGTHEAFRPEEALVLRPDPPEKPERYMRLYIRNSTKPSLALDLSIDFAVNRAGVCRSCVCTEKMHVCVRSKCRRSRNQFSVLLSWHFRVKNDHGQFSVWKKSWTITYLHHHLSDDESSLWRSVCVKVFLRLFLFWVRSWKSCGVMLCMRNLNLNIRYDRSLWF